MNPVPNTISNRWVEALQSLNPRTYRSALQSHTPRIASNLDRDSLTSHQTQQDTVHLNPKDKNNNAILIEYLQAAEADDAIYPDRIVILYLQKSLNPPLNRLKNNDNTNRRKRNTKLTIAAINIPYHDHRRNECLIIARAAVSRVGVAA